MTWGTSLFLFAVGAVLKFAVTATAHGINIQEVGVILMIVGVIGFLLSLLYLTIWRSDTPRYYARRRVVEREPY
jgi:hypothetical protein